MATRWDKVTELIIPETILSIVYSIYCFFHTFVPDKSSLFSCVKKILSFLWLSLILVSLAMVESCVPCPKFREQKKKSANFERENNDLISANEQLTVR